MTRKALMYLQNAKEILSKSPIEDNAYTEPKYVREACSTAYLAILKAIDEYFIEHGLDEKKLPQSVDGYRGMLKRYLSVHDGKLTRRFEILYKELHIAGYYRGLLVDVNVVKEVFKNARSFIEKIS